MKLPHEENFKKLVVLYPEQQADLLLRLAASWDPTFFVGRALICKTFPSLDLALPTDIASFHSSSVHP